MDLCAKVLALHSSAWNHEVAQAAALPLRALVWYPAFVRDPTVPVGASMAFATQAYVSQVGRKTLVLSQISKAAELTGEPRPVRQGIRVL